MARTRHLLGMTTVLLALVASGCGGDARTMAPVFPTEPTPPSSPGDGLVTANAYILPGATNLGSLAFGDEALVIYRGERLRWVNLDKDTHALVADTPGATDFVKTDALASGSEQSLIMSTVGTTTFHCTIHPSMVGTLVVRER